MWIKTSRGGLNIKHPQVVEVANASEYEGFSDEDTRTRVIIICGKLKYEDERYLVDSFEMEDEAIAIAHELTDAFATNQHYWDLTASLEERNSRLEISRASRLGWLPLPSNQSEGGTS